MEKNDRLLIGIPAAGAMIVANLLYFWLVPDGTCKMLVCGFCVGVMLLQGGASIALWRLFGAQKALPVVVSGSAFAIGIFTAGGILLTIDVSVRTALYFLVIFCVLYLVCIGYLSCVAAEEVWSRTRNGGIVQLMRKGSLRNRISLWRKYPDETDAERAVRNAKTTDTTHIPSLPCDL